MEKRKRGEILEVKVGRLSVGGRGVARLDGLVIFIPDTAPDETVEVELTHVKKNFAEGRLLRVIEPSAHRVKPPCPVAGICGGCSWQHVAYPEQLLQKRYMVFESLKKFSGFSISEDLVAPTVASPQEFRYRNRIQLHHDQTRMGFFSRGSHDIADIEDCLITEEKIAEQIPALKRELKSAKPGRLEIYLSENGRIERRGQFQSGNSAGDSPRDSQDTSEAAGPAFSQVNTQQNIQLVNHVVGLLAKHAPAAPLIYDLYSGSGNFTFPIASRLGKSKVIGVELNKEAVELGRSKALQKFPDGRVQFFNSDVDGYLRKASFPQGAVVVLDPPRTGAGLEVVGFLAQSNPSLVVYISCHPVTLARDLSAFSEQNYEIVEVVPFDMFPQTDHVESVTLLRRKTAN